MIQYSTVYIHTYIHTYCIQYSTVPISFSVPNETIFTRKTHLGSRSATIIIKPKSHSIYIISIQYTQISVQRNLTPNKKRVMNGLPSAKLSSKKCRVFCVATIHFV